MLASVFLSRSQEKKGNFLLLPKTARKQLFGELLGLGYLSLLGAAAGERRKAAEQQLATERALAASIEREIVATFGVRYGTRDGNSVIVDTEGSSLRVKIENELEQKREALSSAELEFIVESELYIQRTAAELARDAADSEVARLQILVEEQEPISRERQSRLAEIQKTLRELGAVAARAAVVEDRKSELVSVEADLARSTDQSAQLSGQIETAKRALAQQEMVLAAEEFESQERRARLKDIETLATKLRAQAARAELIGDARLELSKVRAEIKELAREEAAELKTFRDKRDWTQAQLDSFSIDSLRFETELGAEIETGRDRLASAAILEDTRRSELEAARARVRSVQEVEQALAEVRESLRVSQEQYQALQKDIADLEAHLKMLDRKIAEMEALQRKISEVAEEVGDWSMLETALGKDGAQALEIDAAGPEVARLANELLESCYGSPRFSITFETLREKISARGEYSEVFDVKVFDRSQLLSRGCAAPRFRLAAARRVNRRRDS